MNLLLLFFIIISLSQNFNIDPTYEKLNCDVIIIGGSLSAFSAAISSSQEGAKTCLVEPTDWVGGQMSSSAVPCIDFAWTVLKNPKTNETFDTGKVSRAKENVTPLFYELLKKYGNMGTCWVSYYCYLPKVMVEKGFDEVIESVGKSLTILYNTVLKDVEKDGTRITNVKVIQRIPKSTTKCGGYDMFPSKDMQNWYDPLEDERYTKINYELTGEIFIDASEYGELIALAAEDSYLQGLSEKYDGDVSREGNECCGNSITFGFCEKYSATKVEEPPNPYPCHHEDFYSLDKFKWNEIWSYRRLYSKEKIQKSVIVDDVILQNWGKGNDFLFGYFLKNFNETKKEIDSSFGWKGGIQIPTFEESEFLAYGWHYFFKEKNEELKDNVFLDKEILGTCHGLSKVPYIRGTRRSIGLDNFLMKINDISGNFWEKNYTGYHYDDSVAIGIYDVDIHYMETCSYPDYVKRKYYPILPFYIPFRSMTNRKVENLLVTGKNLAQSFLVSSTSRTHPTEFSSGTATGVIGAFMVNNKLQTSREMLMRIGDVLPSIQKYTPVKWTIELT